MKKLWKIRCSESNEEKWTRRVYLSEQDMVGLLRLLLCQSEPHRVCRRLQLLRGWSYDTEHIGTIFT